MQKPGNDIFDQILKNALTGVEGKISADAWEGIAGRMDAAKEKRVVFGWWLLAGILVIGLGIGITYHFTKGKQQQQNELVIDQQQSKPANVEVPQISDAPNQGKVLNSKRAEESVVLQPGNPETLPGMRQTPIRSVIRQRVDTQEAKESLVLVQTGMKDFRALTEFVLKPFNTAIFNASEKGAHEFYKIPTINNGRQKAQNPPQIKGSWEFGLSASPALASKLIKVNGSLSGLLNKDFDGISKSGESRGASYQVGLSANRFLNNWLYLSTGLQYDQIGESVHFDYVIDEVPVFDGSKQRIDSYMPLPQSLIERVQFNGHNSYHFLEIPLKLGIVVPLQSQEITMRTEFGVQYMLLAGTSGKKVDATYLNLFDLKSSKGFARQSVGATVNSGVYYALRSNAEIGLNPYFQINLTSINKSSEVIQSRPYSYGFNIRLNYKLSGIAR